MVYNIVRMDIKWDEMNDYSYCVPYVIDIDHIFLKTAYPDRRFSKLLEDKNETIER